MSWINKARGQAISGRWWSSGLWPCALMRTHPLQPGSSDTEWSALSRAASPRRPRLHQWGIKQERSLLTSQCHELHVLQCILLLFVSGVWLSSLRSQPPPYSACVLVGGRREIGQALTGGSQCILLTSHWPECGHMTRPNCKEGWGM